jgi:Co/Zn/Cd efflux system component
LGERQLDKLEVTGSSPVAPISRNPCSGGDFVLLGLTQHLTNLWIVSPGAYELLGGDLHRHGPLTHSHHHHGPHVHEPTPQGRLHGDHGHTHGLVDPSIKRSRAGVRAVVLSFVVLGLTAAAQVAIFTTTGSIALLADLIHNFGDAATAIPLGAAFLMRSERAEQYAGYFVVFAIFVSAAVAGIEAIGRLIHPEEVTHLPVLIGAGMLGFAGNWLAALIRLAAGRALDSPALIADGNHAKADAYVSLAVISSAIAVSFGLQLADPLIGLGISALIMRITWQSWRTVRDGHAHSH